MEMDEDLKKQFPVHSTKNYAEGNLMTKLGTAKFWAEDAADGIAFLASAFVPGMAISKGAQAGLTISNGLSKFKATAALGEKLAKAGGSAGFRSADVATAF